MATGIAMSGATAVISASNQSDFSGVPAFEQQLMWSLMSVLTGTSPWVIVLGIAALLYSGYRSRLIRRDDRSI